MPTVRRPRRPHGYNQNLELMMGLEPMTSPLPRECSTTELHQPAFESFSSSRARICDITILKAKRPRIKIVIHRIGTSRSWTETTRFVKPCTCNTAEASSVNHDNNPKTTKTPRATYMRFLFAAGLSDRSLSLITFTTQYKTGAQGRIRTSVAHNAADLQSAAINHSATCALLPSFVQLQTP